MSSDYQDKPRVAIPKIRRSLHFVPGGNEKMFTKSLGLAADALILDLEDAVTPERKSEARVAIGEWLEDDACKKKERLVRINPLDSPWGRDDLESVMRTPPDGIVLPKVVNLADVNAVDAIMADMERQGGKEIGSTPIVAIGTEVAAAIFNLPQMLSHRRINGVAWGAEDLSVSLGAKAKRDENGNYLEVFSFTRSICLLAAVGAEVQPIDAVFVDIKDPHALARECKTAADQGYTGKITIHPSQIDIVNAAFTPSAEEIAEARELLEAFEEHAKQGRMAFTFKGEMVDVPHLRKAERILALAE